MPKHDLNESKTTDSIESGKKVSVKHMSVNIAQSNDIKLSKEIVPRNRVSRSGNGFEHKDEQLNYQYEDDRIGLIDCEAGDVFLNRYEVIGLAGQGTFGTVLDVYDTVLKRRQALKVLRSVKRYIDAAHVEIDIIERLQNFDRSDESLCVRLYNHFPLEWKGQDHVCLVFEKLGRNLYEFTSRNNFGGFRLCDVRHFSFQLQQNLAFCHRSGMIHTDLKPENILLCHSDFYESSGPQPVHVTCSIEKGKYKIPVIPKTKLIDFGGAILPEHSHSSIINTRQYRSPEVLLNLKWTYPSDVWCAACIFVELFSGDLLFNTHDHLEHLALYERVLEKTLPVSLQCAAKAKDNADRPVIDVVEDLDTYSRPKNKRRESPSARYTKDRDHRARSSKYPQRNWNLERKRDKSVMRIDELLCEDTAQLRWPENAVNLESVHNVRKAKTLKTIIFGNYADLKATDTSIYDTSNRERQLILDSISESSGNPAEKGANSNAAPHCGPPLEEAIVFDTRDCPENNNPTLGELIEFHDLISQMLKYDPQCRLTAKQALFHPFFDPIRDMYKPPSYLNDDSPLIDHDAYRKAQKSNKK